MDFACAFPESELIGYFTRLGPVGQADERLREQIIEKVRPAYEIFVEEA